MRRDNDLFYVISMIEKIARDTKNRQIDVIKKLGKDTLQHMYDYADVLHSDLPDSVSETYIKTYNIEMGDFNNTENLYVKMPTYWDMGKVFERLVNKIHIEDSSRKDKIDTLIEVYSSWITPIINNYDNYMFTMTEDYLYACIEEGRVLEY